MMMHDDDQMIMNDEMMNDDDESKFWVFDPDLTIICYRGCLNLNCHIGEKVEKIFFYGLKNLVQLGVEIFFLQNPKRRTVFNFSFKTSVFTGLGAFFGTFFVNFLSFCS